MRQGLAIFVSAFLLMQIEPLIARYILPWFGGGPSVWTTCMLFFQVLLVGGYAYAHALARQSPRRQAVLHGALLALTLACLPVIPGAAWKPAGDEAPVGRILALLAATIGLPFFLLAATTPLLQSWWVRAFPGRSPYRLYALSNLGSLLALLSYPLAVEPYLALDRQARLWSVGYLVFLLLVGWCALDLIRRPAAAPAPVPAAPPGSRPGWAAVAGWLGLSACGSLLLLATTNQMCQDVAVVPFLWILPLGLYLLTLILCFERERGYHRGVYAVLLVAGLAAAGLALSRTLKLTLGVQVGLYAAALFATCMVCHGELARRKPHPAWLTGFYLAVAAGGALGGLFVAVVAPLVFSSFCEYHVGLALALLCGLVAWSTAPVSRRRLAYAAFALLAAAALAVVADRVTDWPRALAGSPRLAAVARAARGFLRSHAYYGWSLPVLALLAARALAVDRSVRRPLTLWVTTVPLFIGFLLLLGATLQVHGNLLARQRNFYGVLQVKALRDKWLGPCRILANGGTQHGYQFLAGAARRRPTSYYGHDSGVGLALAQHPRRRRGEPLRVGGIGLGVATLAAYGRTNDVFCFYEINPAVAEFARRYFSYLADSPARIELVLGDARLQLEREVARDRPRDFDVLVVDAFTSDAIPMHLLTRESFAVYRRHLKPDGLLAVHISNRYLDLAPVVRALAVELGWTPLRIESRRDDAAGVGAANWIVVTRNHDFLANPVVLAAASPWEDAVSPRMAWTDDYGSLWQVLLWR